MSGSRATPRPAPRPRCSRGSASSTRWMLLVAGLSACALPRTVRPSGSDGVGPPPTMMGPTLPPEPTPAPMPARPVNPPVSPRVRTHAYTAHSYLPDLQRPGSPTLFVLEDKACTSCKVLRLAIDEVLLNDPALHVVTIDLGPPDGPGAVLRGAWEADELPVGVLWSGTGQQVGIAHGSDAIRALARTHGQRELAIVRISGPNGFGPTPAAAPAAPAATAPASPARGKRPSTQDQREEEDPVRITPAAPPKPKPAPASDTWKPPAPPPPPPPEEDGPRIGGPPAG